MSFAQSTRCIYTTPIKALSNQKFKELGERYGTESVGIMTGDVTINRDAPVLVMTTEVLRNMLYQDDPIREELGFVILDEVHYLADAMRGPTWEEVILELPSHTRLVSLSATVSNSDEFGDWLNSVRGPTTVVSTTWRPVPLQQQVVIGRKVYDAFTRPGHHELAQTERVPNPRLVQSIGSLRDVPRMNPSGRRRIIEILERRELLPAIHFIFSRKQCDRAVIDLLKAGVSLTTREEKRAIRRASQALAEQMSEEDLHIIRYNTFEAALVHGYSAHHAGIYPAQKELIEALMARDVSGLTVVNNNAGNGDDGLAALIAAGKVAKMICSFPRQSDSHHFDEAFRAGRIELELVPQGTLAERIRAGGAGIGGFLTPTGYGTPLADGKETRVIDGRGYVMEAPITGAVALVKAHRADRAGNLVYRKTARNFGPVMCTAARHAAVQVNEIVETGQIDPEVIITPGIFVDTIVEIPVVDAPATSKEA